MHDFRIFIDAPLNSPVRVDTFRHQYHVSSLYRSDFSFKLKLEIQPQVRNTKNEKITSLLQGIYGTNKHQ